MSISFFLGRIIYSNVLFFHCSLSFSVSLMYMAKAHFRTEILSFEGARRLEGSSVIYKTISKANF